MDKKEVFKQVAAGILGVASLFAGVYALKSDPAERFFDYLNRQQSNQLLEEGAQYALLKVKKGDVPDELTAMCYGRPNGETSKVRTREAFYKLNSLGKYIYPGQELYVPFNEETAGNLEACLERSEGIYTLHKDSEGRTYFVPK